MNSINENAERRVGTHCTGSLDPLEAKGCCKSAVFWPLQETSSRNRGFDRVGDEVRDKVLRSDLRDAVRRVPTADSWELGIENVLTTDGRDFTDAVFLIRVIRVIRGNVSIGIIL
jgi:hypothetical protein